MIAIDDGEFIDEESWGLLPIILDLDIILIVMAMGSRRILSSVAEETIQHKRIRTITLYPIDKWYHAGLACQVLDVTAIPPELERIIQLRSNGNPGWVESFLVSLIQAGGLAVTSLDRREVTELGLVAPPLSMILRVSGDTDLEDSESGSLFSDSSRWSKFGEDIQTDGWEMYKYSFRVKRVYFKIFSNKSFLY